MLKGSQGDVSGPYYELPSEDLFLKSLFEAKRHLGMID
jgi:hypothetical protein